MADVRNTKVDCSIFLCYNNKDLWANLSKGRGAKLRCLSEFYGFSYDRPVAFDFAAGFFNIMIQEGRIR